MKKAVLLVSLIVVLIAASLAGVVFHTASAAGPTLSATAMPGMNVAVAGRFWSPMSAVSLYLDTVDPAQLLATATPAFPMGTFNVTLSLPAISKAPHKIIGVQGGNTVNSNNFTPLTTTPVDDRLWAVLQGTAAEVDNIEGKLDNGTFGLAEIKNEVTDIQTKVTDVSDIKTTTNLIWMEVSDGAYGLAEIKTEVNDIQTKVNDPTNGLAAIKNKANDIKGDTGAIISNTSYGLNGLNGLPVIKGDTANIISHPIYGLNGGNGLAAIKNDTNNIWNAVNSPAFGLNAIKTDTTNIISSPTYGLNSGTVGLPVIKNLLTDGTNGLSAIKTLEGTINTEVNNIEAKLDGTPTSAIKGNANAIWDVVNSASIGLNQIVNNPTFGLNGPNGLAAIKTDTNNIINSATYGLNSGTNGLPIIKALENTINSTLNTTKSTVDTTDSTVTTINANVNTVNSEVTNIEAKLDGTHASMLPLFQQSQGAYPTGIFGPYASVKHVHLTILSLNPSFDIMIRLNGVVVSLFPAPELGVGVYTYEFDTDQWQITNPGGGIGNYAATITGLQP